jgi:hypothetical protein
MALFAHAILAAFSAMMLLVAVVNEGVETLNRFDIDIAATATITAIRPTEFDIGFTAEGGTSIATIACLNVDFDLIEKLHDLSFV